MNHPGSSPYFEEVPIFLDDVCSDKGFDSEKNQQYVQKERNACSFVDVRGIPKRGRYRKQVYRRKQRDPDQWQQRYRQMRNCIESKNASMKHPLVITSPVKTSTADDDTSLFGFLQKT